MTLQNSNVAVIADNDDLYLQYDSFLYSSEGEKKAIFVMFAIYFVTGILRSTNIDFPYWTTIGQLIQLSMLGLILLLSLLDVFQGFVKLHPIVWILLLTGVINFILTKHTFVLGFAILFLGFSNMNFKSLLKNYLIVLNVTFIAIVLCSLIGIIPIGTSERTDTIRYNFGFSTSTLAASIFFFIVLGHVYLNQKRTSYLYLLIAVAVAGIIYYFSDTRTGFFLTLFVCVLCALDKVIPFDEIFSRWTSHSVFNALIICIPLFVLILDFYLVHYYSTGTALAYRLDSIMSTRLSLSWNLVKTEGFSLFGKDIPRNVNGSYYQSDICYLYYGFNYGIVTMVFAVVSEMLMIRKSIKTKESWLCIVVMFLVLDGMFEPYLLDYKYQIFTFVLVDGFLSKKDSFLIKVERRWLEEGKIIWIKE